jgi:uncharacterized protein YceK
MRNWKKIAGTRDIRVIGLALLMLVAIALSGCPALMVPSLAYQGYKSTHESSSTTAKSSHKSSASQPSSAASDNSIE